MVILVIIAGLYLIGLVGYYKLVQRVQKGNGLKVSNSIVLFLSIIWPIMTYYSLVKEAASDA